MSGCTSYVGWPGGMGRYLPGDWTEAAVVPVYKGKGDKSQCGNYRGLSLLRIPHRVYSRNITERIFEVGEEQGGFRKGKGCVDSI